MGRRGPPPTPTALKKLAGNPGGRRLNPAEPIPPAGEPDIPPELDERERAVWSQIVPSLAKLGLARRIDGQALMRYCQLVVFWHDCIAHKSRHGRTYPIRADSDDPKKPGRIVRIAFFEEVRLIPRLARELLAIEREFGLTPSSRSRITVQAEQSAKGDTDEIKRKFFADNAPRRPAAG